jgi:hypothetical protein
MCYRTYALANSIKKYKLIKRYREHILIFLDKEYILISEDTNYTQPLQQRSTLAVSRMHTAKRLKKKYKNRKVPLQ